jgi:manganese/zinc/iron transport system substrate-binding protein
MRPNGKMKVLSTTAMIDDIVQSVGGDRVDHLALIIGEVDPHSYELVKGDDEKIAGAQVIFYNGLGLEHGASLRYAIEHHPLAISLGDCVQKSAPKSILSKEHTLDPHIWMDISLWVFTVDPIAETLSKMDPDAGDFYRVRAAALKEKMLQEHQAIQRAFSAVPENKRYLVTSHDAFHYFTRAYLAAASEREHSEWSKRCDAPEGLAPDGQLSAADIQEIVEHLLRHRIEVVFSESNVSTDSLKKILDACKRKGHAVRISPQPLYGDATGGKEYLGMIRHNADVILKAWEEEK